MKRLFLFINLVIASFAFTQNKLALLVAVGDYGPNSGIGPIAAVNDVKYIRSVLTKHGFKDIKTLINAKATKAAILKSLTDLALKAKKNDIVVINFGCHGQQIRDQRTIELGKDEDDGYDEALMPYDARGQYSPTKYRGENHLRDDDLYPKLLAIRKNVGANGSLLVLIDACHSGTGTRAEGFAVTRGDPVPFPDPENPLDSVINLSAAEARQGFFEASTDSLSNLVVISGSAPHQENKQVVINYEELGSLSYAFYKAMNDMPPGNNYALLFEKIKATIQALIPDQMPMIEGDTRQIIFSGKYTAKEERSYLRVGGKTVGGTHDSVFTVDRGMMDNMVVGSSCKIYKAGHKEVFASGTIIKVENFRSIGVADKLLKKVDLYEMKQEEEGYGSMNAVVKLKFEDPAAKSTRLETQVKNFFQPYKFISLADNADFQLAIKNETGIKKAFLTDRNNKLLWQAQVSKDDSLLADDNKLLITNIKKAMRVKYLRTMPDGGDLAPFISAQIIADKGNDKNGEAILEEGDAFSLVIRNNTDTKLFYTVLDIYPDNQVKVLYPTVNKEPGDYMIEAKATVIRKLSVSKGTPPGMEFLKIIVSKEAMDLRSVFDQKIQRDEMRSFQTVLDDIFNTSENSTRADISNIKVEEVGIITVHFTNKMK